MSKIISGTILNPQPDYSVEVVRNGGIAIDEKGKIIDYGKIDLIIELYPNFKIINHRQSVITPGFIDLHTHLPQLAACGMGKGELLPWLENYIFPLEARFSDNDFALKMSEIFFKRIISKGTTTAVIYTSTHQQAAEIAFSCAEKHNFRAFIGKSMMDRNVPPSMLKSAEDNINESLALIKKWHGQGKLQYVMTPRFAVSCSKKLLEMSAEVARTEDLFIQTHLSENMSEIEYIKQIFPECDTYTDVYEKTGLLGSKSILAHCIYLSDAELGQIRANNAIIAHCPTSNRFLSSGIMALSKYLSGGLQVGLGTDVAAGYSLSMINEAREAIESSKLYSLLVEKAQLVTPCQALSIATIKAAEYLGIDTICGNFQNGKSADLAVFEMPEFSNINDLSDDDIISVAIYSSDNPKAVYIGGEQVLNR